MKCKKPTRFQRKILQDHKLDTYKWYVQKDTAEYLQVVNVDTNEVRIINKSDKEP